MGSLASPPSDHRSSVGIPPSQVRTGRKLNDWRASTLKIAVLVSGTNFTDHFSGHSIVRRIFCGWSHSNFALLLPSARTHAHVHPHVRSG